MYPLASELPGLYPALWQFFTWCTSLFYLYMKSLCFLMNKLVFDTLPLAFKLNKTIVVSKTVHHHCCSLVVLHKNREKLNWLVNKTSTHIIWIYPILSVNLTVQSMKAL
jgi:hypothetical protein